MYAIVKTGGKQYKVAPGDRINIEKLDAEVGAEVELPVICVVDGETVEADPAKAAATKVVATVIEQFKGEKVLVFKFKKRKNYKKLRGHRPVSYTHLGMPATVVSMSMVVRRASPIMEDMVSPPFRTNTFE